MSSDIVAPIEKIYERVRRIEKIRERVIINSANTMTEEELRRVWNKAGCHAVEARKSNSMLALKQANLVGQLVKQILRAKLFPLAL